MTAGPEQDDGADVLNRVRADLLVRALLRDLEPPAPPRTSVWDRPFTKLIAPFVLTTVVGTWLTVAWQTWQWHEQQEYAARQERVKTRMKLMSTLTRSVGETVTVAEDVLIFRQVDLDENLGAYRAAELQKLLTKWFEQNREWRVEEKVLYAQLTANFCDPQVGILFRELQANRGEIFLDVNELLQRTQGVPFPYPESQTTTDLSNRIRTFVMKTTGRERATKKHAARDGILPRLTQVMIEETKRDQCQPSRDWRWWRRSDSRALIRRKT
jgi:hypothetical protein